MRCSYCNMSCVANEVSCPNCGAPLPVPKAPVGNIWGRTSITGSAVADSDRSGTSRKTPPNFQKRNSSTASRPQQLNFPDVGHGDNSNGRVAKPSFETYNSISHQTRPIEPEENQSTDRRQAFLPVPYQEMPPTVRQTTMSLQLIP